jgi:hypothetical protein
MPKKITRFKNQVKINNRLITEQVTVSTQYMHNTVQHCKTVSSTGFFFFQICNIFRQLQAKI